MPRPGPSRCLDRPERATAIAQASGILLAGLLAGAALAGCLPHATPGAGEPGSPEVGASHRSVVLTGPVVPGTTLALRLARGAVFTAATRVELTVAGRAEARPIEVLERSGDRLAIAWPMTTCGRFELRVGDPAQPTEATAKIPVLVTTGCAPAPELSALRPARVDEVTGRWTGVVLEGRHLAPGDRVSLVHRGDPRIEPADVRHRFLSPDRLVLHLPAELRCGDWQVSVDRPGLVTRPARATLHWCPMNVLNVLSYNVAMVPAVGLPWLQPWLPFPTAACEPLCWTKDTRAAALADHPDLLGHDVVVLQELFSRAHRRTIVDGLRQTPAGYPEASRMVPGDWPFAGGGVVILSRWPIEAEALEPFTHCAGSISDTTEATRNDCLAKKGVAHAAIRKGTRLFHVFATHLDAGRGAADRAAREQQLHAIAAFVRNRDIPADEPVIIAGDLNTERFDPAAERRLGEILHASYGAFAGCSPAPLHPTTPAGGGLDYVLYSTRHLEPLDARGDASGERVPTASSHVVCPKSDGLDLSDHYAVLGSFVFPAWPATANGAGRPGPPIALRSLKPADAGPSR